MNNNDKSYFNYLEQRSILGRLYRNYILYPRLTRQLSGNILDYGCGIGDFILYCSNTVGVDINKHNISYCKSLNLSAELIENNIIPFEDDSFSNVVMDNVIEHITKSEIDSVLNEISRVLKNNGKLLIGVPGTKGYKSDNDHKQFYSETDLNKLLENHDYTNSNTIHMPIHALWLQDYMSQYCVYSFFEKT